MSKFMMRLIALAKQGMKFASAHGNSTVCSRSSTSNTVPFSGMELILTDAFYHVAWGPAAADEQKCGEVKSTSFAVEELAKLYNPNVNPAIKHKPFNQVGLYE